MRNILVFIYKNWPLVVIFILLFIFGLPFFRYGKIPFPGDLLVGAYYPWFDYKWGYITGVPVKNPLISDVFSQFVPWKYYAITALKQFEIPLWDWSIFNGMPFMATLHTGVFYPLNFIYFLTSNFWMAHALFLLIQPLLAFLFSYWLFIHWSRSKYISTLAATTFAFSGFMMVWFEWGNIGHTLLWLPLLFLVTDFFFLDKLKWNIFISIIILILSISFTAGHIQTFFYTFLFWSLYFLFKAFNTNVNCKKNLLVLGIILASFFSLNIFQIIPFIDLTFNSIRVQENYISSHNYGLYPFKQWLVIWAPDSWGNPTTYNYAGFWNYQEFVPFLGSIVWLIILGLLTHYFYNRFFKKKYFYPPLLFFFVSLLSIFLMINPLSGKIIYQLKIPLLSTSSASRLTSLLSFIVPSILVLSFRNRKSIAYRLKYILIISFFWLFFIFIIDFFKYRGILLWSVPNTVFLRNQILPLGLSILFIGFLLFYLYLSSILPQRIYFFVVKTGLILIFLAQVFDLLRFGLKYNPFVDQKLIFPKTPIIEYLEKHKNEGRIITYNSDPLLPHNVAVMYGLSYVDGYHPLVPTRQSSFINLVNNNKFEPSDRYGKINNVHNPYLKYAALKYLLILKRTKKDKYSPNGIIKINSPFYKKVFEDKTTVILKNTTTYPFAFIYNYNKDIKPNKTIGKIISYKQGINSIKITYKSSIPAHLFLSHAYSPYWKAILDKDKKLKITKIKYIFMSISVPPGTHTVNIEYLPLIPVLTYLDILLGSVIIANIIYGFIKQSKSKL